MTPDYGRMQANQYGLRRDTSVEAEMPYSHSRPIDSFRASRAGQAYLASGRSSAASKSSVSAGSRSRTTVPHGAQLGSDLSKGAESVSRLDTVIGSSLTSILQIDRNRQGSSKAGSQHSRKHSNRTSEAVSGESSYENVAGQERSSPSQQPPRRSITRSSSARGSDTSMSDTPQSDRQVRADVTDTEREMSDAEMRLAGAHQPHPRALSQTSRSSAKSSSPAPRSSAPGAAERGGDDADVEVGRVSPLRGRRLTLEDTGRERRFGGGTRKKIRNDRKEHEDPGRSSS